MVEFKYMIITYYGHSCFKIQSSNLTIITDPFDKSIGLSPPRGQADVVLVSHQHYDHNNISSISGKPFVIDQPGEYEIRGIYVQGVASFHDDKEGQERGRNIIYIVETEEIKFCHMGDFGQQKLTEKQLEEINGIDVLMIPVGGVYTINTLTAVKIVHQLEPRIVIPMHYKIPGLNLKIEGVGAFLKELGVVKKQAVDKLTIKKKDLLQKETEVMLMKM